MTLRELVEKFSRRTELFRPAPGGAVKCLACARACVISESSFGFCRVRFNRRGELFAPWGYASGIALDPVEKKPFFHVLPGAKALSFGMYGCNFRCAFCQNSQTALPAEAGAESVYPQKISPEAMIAGALENSAPLIVSTYNEPLITVEWARAVFSEAKKKGLRTAFVSNGYASKEALEFMRPCLDFYKADLKGFNAERYLGITGGELKKVLQGIELVYSMGFWLEVVTLVVPGFNDSPEELGAAASFIAGLSKNIPWHVTAFYPAHKMSDTNPTPPATVLRAREIGLKKGLKFVYAGNIAGSGDAENTLCPACGKLLVERRGFSVIINLLGGRGTCPALLDQSSGAGNTGEGIKPRSPCQKGGACPACGAPVPGVWK
ncbi:MAG: AmmeMemoRadiSam system radical SAM enzyme [Elusimicrobia bacterium]|nr:AmmeMemoRadiSam system radical SAM enzyme [Elusimicrobiota bacterium]